MFHVTETIDIAGPPDAVFAFLTDPARRPQWDHTVMSEQLLTPPPVAPGSRIRTRMSVMGREVEFEWRVTAFDAPREMAAESDSGTLPARMRFDFAATDTGCRVRSSLEAEPTGLLRFVEPIVEGTARSTLAEGLARAKRLIEEERSAGRA
ncbi:SRPBCC family protein [Microbacterium enclense]|uniref:SRPBCC family protein n=1 Tax=Microbacterium enclense TaxID=993073 RepID=UPI0036D7CA4E